MKSSRAAAVVLWLILDKFKAAAVKECKIDKINCSILVYIGVFTPMRFFAICPKPVRCQNGKIFKIVGLYPDCVCAVEVSWCSEAAKDFQLKVAIVRDDIG